MQPYLTELELGLAVGDAEGEAVGLAVGEAVGLVVGALVVELEPGEELPLVAHLVQSTLFADAVLPHQFLLLHQPSHQPNELSARPPFRDLHLRHFVGQPAGIEPVGAFVDDWVGAVVGAFVPAFVGDFVAAAVGAFAADTQAFALLAPVPLVVLPEAHAVHAGMPGKQRRLQSSAPFAGKPSSMQLLGLACELQNSQSWGWPVLPPS